MSVALDDHHLPTIVAWLVDLNGEAQVRGILGEDFEGIRSGRLGLHAIAPDLQETLCKLVEGAIAAGMNPPLPPEPDKSLPEVPQAPAEGAGLDFRSGPGHSEGRAAAPPTVTKSPSRAAPSVEAHSERVRIIRSAIRSRMEDRDVLLRLLRHLREAEELRPHHHPLNKWITLAKHKVMLCLVADYHVRIPDARGHIMPRKEKMAFYSRLIKRSEKEMEELSRRPPLLRFFLSFLGPGYLPPEDVLEQVARHQNLKISDELMQAILRQGSDQRERL